MNELDVRIVKLEPMRVASFHAYGDTPENEASAKLVEWAKPRGLLDNPGQHRIFGFDNPNPSPGSSNYGYEFWIQIESDTEVEAGIATKEFSGGLYAVTRCEPGDDPWGVIPAAWMRLVEWRENNSKYELAMHQALEEHLGKFPSEEPEEFILDLYLPIVE